MKTYQSPNPVKSQKEAEQVIKYLTETAAKALGISTEEARRRVGAMYKFDILKDGHPEDPATQMRIENFLRIPFEKYAHLL